MESIIHLKDLELERRGKLHSHYDSKRLLKRFSGRCSFCDMTPPNGEKLTLDHLIPRARGGTDESYNLFPACKECNGSKGHKTFEAWYPRHWSYDSDRMVEILDIHNTERDVAPRCTDYESLHMQWLLNNQVS